MPTPTRSSRNKHIWFSSVNELSGKHSWPTHSQATKYLNVCGVGVAFNRKYSYACELVFRLSTMQNKWFPIVVTNRKYFGGESFSPIHVSPEWEAVNGHSILYIFYASVCSLSVVSGATELWPCRLKWPSSSSSVHIMHTTKHTPKFDWFSVCFCVSQSQ